MLEKPTHHLSQYVTQQPLRAKRDFHEHGVDTAVDVPAIPKMNYSANADMWTPPPYWRNLLQEDRKIEVRGFRSIIVGFALFGIIVAIIFFWKIVVAVLAMRIILS